MVASGSRSASASRSASFGTSDAVAMGWSSALENGGSKDASAPSSVRSVSASYTPAGYDGPAGEVSSYDDPPPQLPDTLEQQLPEHTQQQEQPQQIQQHEQQLQVQQYDRQQQQRQQQPPEGGVFGAVVLVLVRLVLAGVNGAVVLQWGLGKLHQTLVWLVECGVDYVAPDEHQYGHRRYPE